MNNYKIIDPKGLSVNGKLHEEGGTITGEPKQVHIATALHFKQIKKVEGASPKPPADPAADAKAKAGAEAKAKAEEAAKKKAEADAKAKAGK